VDNNYYYSGNAIYDEFDLERFAFFSKAALECLGALDFVPDVIHCNDWSTALVPVMLDYFYRHTHFYGKIKTVFTVHNLRYQGVYDIGEVIDKTGLGGQYMTVDKMEYYGKSSLMKGALMMSDAVTTVSPTYSKEIMTEEYGEGLHEVMQNISYKLSGIVNGIDYTTYSPENDPFIAVKYSDTDCVQGKAANKKELQKQLGLPEKDVPVMSVVSRLYEQKGIDLIINSLDELLKEDVQIVFLGTGEKWLEERLRFYAENNGDKVAAVIGFDNALAHRIYAASDIFLMPSRFEPCGLSQLIAMKYGAVPVVRATGGLKDTVADYTENSSQGNGFAFEKASPDEFARAVRKSLELYREGQAFTTVSQRNMRKDFSWKNSTALYIELYERLLKDN